MQNFTAKDIADKFDVSKRVAQDWLLKGLFPNAYKETIEPFGEIWYAPVSDVENFEQPRPGRPKDDAPTQAAIAKRNSRASYKEKQAA